MKYALIAVVTGGAAIGLALPGARTAPAAPAPAPAAVAVAPEERPRPTVIERGNNGHFYTVGDVNGEPIKFVVDTGASVIALTEEDARRIGIKFSPLAYEVVATGASGDVMGQEVTLKEVVIDGKHVSGPTALVLRGLTVSLLGQNYLRKYDLSINGDTMTIK